VVERVDPATLRVVEAFDTGADADSRMAVGLGSLWVTRPPPAICCVLPQTGRPKLQRKTVEALGAHALPG
jgi:hypothetical protein